MQSKRLKAAKSPNTKMTRNYLSPTHGSNQKHLNKFLTKKSQEPVKSNDSEKPQEKKKKEHRRTVSNFDKLYL